MISNKQNKKVLITGGAGFIGKFVKQKLKECGFNVLSIGRKKEEDVCIELNDPKLSQLISEFSPSIVCHFASGSNIARAEENKEKEFKNTVTSAGILVSALNKMKNINFLYLSSQAVYGFAEKLPVSEKCLPFPVTEYGKNKFEVEKIVSASELNYLIFRVSSVYGPTQDSNKSGAIAKFINKLRSNQSPTVFNSFETFSDYIYVNDIVSAIILFITEWDSLNIRREVFNLGSGVPVTLKELFEILYKFFPKAPKPTIVENKFYPDERQKGLYLDINKIELRSNWKPVYSINSGLQTLMSEEFSKAIKF